MYSFELIEAAATLIETTGWTQGCSARDASGKRVGVPGFAGDPPAACYCAYGALCQVSWDNRTAIFEDVHIDGTFNVAIGKLNDATGYSLAGYNDAPGRTKEEVLTLMRATAAKLRAKQDSADDKLFMQLVGELV